jgi:TetR/AcrR family transcriptional repressor of multidrug resistance operon
MRVKDSSKENAIREKAMEMIVNHGFEGLSMQKLAKEANVSPATIYIYFKNKEDLVNQLYIYAQDTFCEIALAGFDPEAKFADGLWQQWQNRFRFITEYPIHYSFYEQFRNSPLVKHTEINVSGFKQSMHLFLTKAIKQGEIKKTDPEIFWSIAYGSFYTLVRFHLNGKGLRDKPFTLTQTALRQAFEMVIKSFQS